MKTCCSMKFDLPLSHSIAETILCTSVEDTAWRNCKTQSFLLRNWYYSWSIRTDFFRIKSTETRNGGYSEDLIQILVWEWDSALLIKEGTFCVLRMGCFPFCLSTEKEDLWHSVSMRYFIFHISTLSKNIARNSILDKYGGVFTAHNTKNTFSLNISSLLKCVFLVSVCKCFAHEELRYHLLLTAITRLCKI